MYSWRNCSRRWSSETASPPFSPMSNFAASSAVRSPFQLRAFFAVGFACFSTDFFLRIGPGPPRPFFPIFARMDFLRASSFSFFFSSFFSIFFFSASFGFFFSLPFFVSLKSRGLLFWRRFVFCTFLTMSSYASSKSIASIIWRAVRVDAFFCHILENFCCTMDRMLSMSLRLWLLRIAGYTATKMRSSSLSNAHFNRYLLASYTIW
mmetsp:Transcript_22870/g.45960  ORF Transcript_22870/g.45960 Transcript_22870/m.45960 type:complete len:207 (+) Transcript_22870:1306-1926(+)